MEVSIDDKNQIIYFHGIPDEYGSNRTIVQIRNIKDMIIKEFTVEVIESTKADDSLDIEN